MTSGNRVELRVGKKVIAEVSKEEMGRMRSLIESFYEIRNSDAMWEPENDTLPCFDAYDKTLRESGIAKADTFDVFDKATLWYTNGKGDSLKIMTLWNKGF